LKPQCIEALRRIFKLCDTDKDNILSDNELNEFQVSKEEREKKARLYTSLIESCRENALMLLYNHKNWKG
jgi:hypothetical protein